MECTRWTKFGCWSSMSGCFSSPVWALPRESLTNISFRGNSLWRWQHDFALPHWLDVTRWILTCLCWTSSGHRKLAATYLLSLCIYLRSCCLTWKSLHIALYSMFWAWQLYLWICFIGKQWMPLIQKLFRAILAECALWKKAALLEILPVTCFMWSCITSEFTCDTMIPKHDFLSCFVALFETYLWRFWRSHWSHHVEMQHYFRTHLSWFWTFQRTQSLKLHYLWTYYWIIWLFQSSCTLEAALLENLHVKILRIAVNSALGVATLEKV